MTPITAADVINKRQNELVAEGFDLAAKLKDLEKQVESVKQRLAEIEIEYRILDDYDKRGEVTVSYTKETVTVRQQSDKINIEDAIKKVFDAAGRPLKFSEIRAQLEKFGWVWSNYYSAHSYLTRLGAVEPTGARGFYQLRKVSF